MCLYCLSLHTTVLNSFFLPLSQLKNNRKAMQWKWRDSHFSWLSHELTVRTRAGLSLLVFLSLTKTGSVCQVSSDKLKDAACWATDGWAGSRRQLPGHVLAGHQCEVSRPHAWAGQDPACICKGGQKSLRTVKCSQVILNKSTPCSF